MSYDIYIGEAAVEVFGGDDEGERADLRVYVPAVERQDAPCFDGDEMTGRGNHRHPGYSQWEGFLQLAGLQDLFLGEQGLMREHPGCQPLLPADLELVNEALDRWRDAHRGATAGFGDGQDPALARLLWLVWWMGWALRECEVPAVYNF